MKIGQFIYTARKRKGISQEELSSLLDVSRQSISLWETDQTIPTLDKLQAMCKILDVSMDELTGVESIKEKQIGSIKPKSSIEEWNARLEQQNKKFELVFRSTLFVPAKIDSKSTSKTSCEKSIWPPFLHFFTIKVFML